MNMKQPRSCMHHLILCLALVGCAAKTSPPQNSPETGPAKVTAAKATDPVEPDRPRVATMTPEVEASEPSQDLAEMKLGDALTPAATRAREGNWSEVVREVDRAWPAIEAGDQLDDMCAAQALKGRALVAQGSDDKAAIPFAKVLSIYEGRMLTSVGELSNPTGLARARVVVEAVSEATFFTAARRDRELRKAKGPVYRGSGEREDVERFVREEVTVWLKHRLDAIEQVDKAYQGVLSVEPRHSPRWAVKAAERIGALYVSLVSYINNVPVPKVWTGPGDIAGLSKQDVRDAYKAKLDEVSMPYTTRAKAAYTECAALAKRYRVNIPEAIQCAEFIQDHD